MTKTIKLFSLLLMFVFSTVFAESDLDKYRLYVTKVDPELHCFEMSNGMILNTVKKRWKREILPEVGTEIFLLPFQFNTNQTGARVEDGEFIAAFKGENRVSVLLLWMSPGFEQHALTFVSAKPVKWFFSSVQEYVIELSDGSKWKCIESANFDKGDPVIVTGAPELGKWCIINPNPSSFEESEDNSTITYPIIIVTPNLESEEASKKYTEHGQKL